MGIQEFYRKFITEDLLYELSRRRKKDYQSIDEFVVYRYREMTNPYHISWLVEQLHTRELNLIERLKSSQSQEGYYRVEFSEGEYPFLIEQFILIPFDGHEGVVHEGILRRLIKELNKGSKNLKWMDEISPLKKTILLSYSDLDLEDLLRGVTITQLKGISKALSHSPESLQKEVYVNDLKDLLTDKERIKNILLSLSSQSFQVIKEHAENDHPFYDGIKDHKELVDSGLVISLEDDYGITHPDILGTVRDTDLNQLENQRHKNILLKNKQKQSSYNAFKIKISLIGGENTIYREMIIPTRLNFYELHLIIQTAFDWSRSHHAKFFNDNFEIRVYSTDQENTSPQRSLLTSSHTQVDAMLTEYGNINYIYNYQVKWQHKVELLEFLSEEGAVYPEIVGYDGPCPIETLKGIEEFDKIFLILKDKDHPEYIETARMAKSSKYKMRYPRSAINRRLQRLFSKKFVITEFNDKEIKSVEN